MLSIMRKHRQTTLGRQWQTIEYNPCQESAAAAPMLYKEDGTSKSKKVKQEKNVAAATIKYTIPM